MMRTTDLLGLSGLPRIVVGHLALVVALAAGCSDGNGGSPDSGADAAADALPGDAEPPIDTGVGLDASPADTSPPDAAPDAAPDGGPPPGRAWTFFSVGPGAKPMIALDGAGQVHVASIYEAEPGWVRHTSFAPDATEAPAPTDVANGYFYGPIDVGAQTDGTPVVAYHDHDLEDQVLAIGDGAGGFTTSPMTNPGHDGWYNAMHVDGDVVHTATYDPGGFGGRGVYYGVWDGSWTVELAVAGSFDYAGGLSIARASDGTVYIAYFDDGAGRGMLSRRGADGTWTEQTLDPDTTAGVEVGRFPFVRLDSDGDLHVVFLSRETATSGTVRYGTGTWDALVYEDVGTLDGISIGFSGARNTATLAIDPATGVAVVAAQSSSRSWLAVRGAGGFAVESIETASTLGQQTSIAVGAGVIHLVYWQMDGAVPGTVMYGRAAL